MSALATSALRQRLAAAIATALSASGWRPSTATWDQFGRGSGDAESRQHLGYAVGCPRGEWAGGDRQKRAEGARMHTEVRIWYAYRIAALDQVVSYDAALDAGASLVVAVTGASSADLQLLYLDTNHEVDEQGWFFGDISFRAEHRVTLT